MSRGGGEDFKEGRGGGDVLTFPCMIRRMVRVTLGLSVGDSVSREAILLE